MFKLPTVFYVWILCWSLIIRWFKRKVWVVDNRCYHCGKPPEADGDHSCPCPNADGLCPEHDRAPDTPEELT